MKYLVMLFILATGIAAWGFYSKHRQSCEGCAPVKELGTVEWSPAPNPPIACTLNDLELVERKETTLRYVLSFVEEVKELDTGYALRFPNASGLMEKLSEVVELESQCCAFLTFDLNLDPSERAIWLKMTGQEGTKKFLESMLLDR